MTIENYEEFTGLADTGYENKEPVSPEDEFFHAAYIAGASRQNHKGITEQSGKLQIRGVEYNLDKINMVITHVKKVLANNDTSQGGQNKLRCFSYKTGAPPWLGTTLLPDGNKRQCGSNSAERAADPFCKDCREQIIMAGIYCDTNGAPVLNEEKKPVFIFIRGKGMKYNNVATYLSELFNEDIDPLFTPVTEESRRFEKIAVNNKRYVTSIGMGTASSQFGDKAVFTLTKAARLENSSVMDVLKITKKTLDKFNEKFDWSKNNTGATGYGQQQAAQAVSSDQMIPDANQAAETQQPANQAPPKETTPPPQQQYSFEDLDI